MFAHCEVIHNFVEVAAVFVVGDIAGTRQVVTFDEENYYSKHSSSFINWQSGQVVTWHSLRECYHSQKEANRYGQEVGELFLNHLDSGRKAFRVSSK